MLQGKEIVTVTNQNFQAKGVSLLVLSYKQFNTVT